MSAATAVTLSASFSTLALTVPTFPPLPTSPHTHSRTPSSTPPPSVLSLSSSVPAAAPAHVASFRINPLNEYQSPNTRQLLTLAVASTPLVSSSSRIASTAASLPPSSPSLSPSSASSSSSVGTARSSRRRQRTDEEQSPTGSSHALHTTSSSSSSGVIDHITADFSLLSTLDTQQPAKRIHTDTPHSQHTSIPPSSSQPLSSACSSPFIHPLKPKPVKRRTARTTASTPIPRPADEPQLQPFRQQPCKAVAAARLAVDDLLYDGGGGESEAEWEAEHGSELRFLLGSMHVADKNVQAGCMPYIL